jgi:hypothetical protein
MASIPPLAAAAAPVQITLWDFIIGPVTLTKFEVPQEFEIGFEKQLAEHKTLSSTGVSRIDTHVLAVYPLPTQWKGTLYGATALTRFQAIERLATQTNDVTWTYGPLQYNVQVQKVIGKPHSWIEIDYEISVVVKQALTKNANLPTPTEPFDISTQTFLDDGNDNFDNLVDDPDMPASLIAQQTALNNQITAASPIRNASYPTLFALQVSLTAFNQAFYAYLAAKEAKQLDAGGQGFLLNALQAYANYSQFATALSTLTGGTIGNQQVQAGAGVNLFSLSNQFYPNLAAADGANLIAQANQLSDYWINQPQTLTIPSLTL